MQGLQGFFAAQGLHGLQGFFAAQGLHGLQGFFAAQGLQALAFTLQGLQAPQALVAQGLHPAAIWIEGLAALDTAVGKATALVARVATLSAITVFLIIHTSKELKPDEPADTVPEPTGSLMAITDGPRDFRG